MTLKPPRAFSRSAAADPIAAALEAEILGEKVATYARLVEALERALAALRDAAPGAPGEAERETRVSEALMHVVVQRDLLRLPGTERFLAELGVPPTLAARLLPPRPIPRRRR